MEETYCEVSECERPTDGHGPNCSMHTKRKQRGKSLHAPVAERKTRKERVIDAYSEYEDAAANADEATYQAKERAFTAAAREYGIKDAHAELIRTGIAAARARGVAHGRRPAITAEEAEQLLKKAGSIRRAAALRGVNRKTIAAALRRVDQKTLFSGPREPRT